MLTRRKYRRFARTALIALALIFAAQAVAETMTVYAATDGAKVYDARGEAIGTLPAGTELTLTGVKGGVCRVEKGGNVAYMLKSELTRTPAEPAAPQPEEKQLTAYVKTDGAKVCDASGKAVGSLALNARVTVTAVKDGVCRIAVNGGAGYMRASDLSAEKAPEQSAAPACAEAYVIRDGAKVYSAGGKVIATLSQSARVTVTAVKGDVCRVSGGGRTGYMYSADLSCEKPEAQPQAVAPAAASASRGLAPAKGTAREMDWWDSDIQTIFARGVVAQITDVETGLTWREKRFGGTNHADCQPLTAADTAALKQAYGGVWSWNRRAVFVTINGVNYAASINGMPHGGGSIDGNDFNGHHCIHFTNSRTHGSNKVCPLHQAAIKRAAAATLK